MIVGKPYFSDQFKKIIKRYIKVGYNLDVMRQSACLVLNPKIVSEYDQEINDLSCWWKGNTNTTTY